MAEPIEDTQAAEEILRQAQALIGAQLDASKAIDAKATSVMQASLSLAGASLGGAAVAMAERAWLPGWAGVGLAAMAAMFILAAYLAAWTLRATNAAAPALRPNTLLEQGMHEVPARQMYLFVAFELNAAIEQNDVQAREAGERVRRALSVSLAAPLVGCAVAGAAALADHRTALFGGLVLGAALAVLWLAIAAFGPSRR